MYIIEGNVGAGKSTLLKLIGQHLSQVLVATEPVDDWQSQISGQSLLANFYQEPKRWAYTLETLTMIQRAKDHIKKQESSGTKMIERSVYSGHYCFAKNSYEQGFMNGMEWQMYQEWFGWLVQQRCREPHGFIYLRVNPTVAYKRVKKRNRHAEKTLSLSYLKQMDQKHEALLNSQNGTLQSVPVLTLDGDENFEKDEAVLASYLDKIQDFICVTSAGKFGKATTTCVSL